MGALNLELAIERLALMGKRIPHHMVIYFGAGGKSKGARSKLRSNVFGRGHQFISSSVLGAALKEEFRKQGSDFYGASLLTIQEADALVVGEKAFRAFSAGEGIACRLPRATHSPLLSWAKTGKFWGINVKKSALPEHRRKKHAAPPDRDREGLHFCGRPQPSRCQQENISCWLQARR